MPKLKTKPVHKFVVRRLLKDYDSGMKLAEIAAKHKVSFSTISRVAAMSGRADRRNDRAAQLPVMKHLVAVAAEQFSVKPGDILKGAKVDRRHSKIKQVVCWVANKHYGYSLNSIKHSMGYLDHTTVMYAVERVSTLKALKFEALRLQLEVQRRPFEQPKSIS